MAGNSESRFVICEDAAQVAKIAEVRGELPGLEAVIVDRARGRRRRRDLARRPARARPRPRRRRGGRARGRGQAARTRTPSSTRPAPPARRRAACSRTATTARCSASCESIGALESGEVAYLYLPLAHSYALLIQLLAIDLGSTIAYFGGDTKQIVAELNEVHPTYLPSVPRIFEKIYTLVTSNGDPEQIKGATRVGLKVRAAAGRRPGRSPPSSRQHFDAADEALFKNVRAAFGGNLKQANTGAAPIAKEILEFFYACGVPVLEGYGMTETSTVVDHPDPRALQARHGRLRDPRQRGPDRRRRRDPAQGPEHLPGLLQDAGRVVGHDRRRLAAHGRPRLARRGRLPLDHRPQEGHHHHRGRQEPHAGQPRERPQAVPLDLAGRDVRRPPALPGRAASRSTPRRLPRWRRSSGIEDADPADARRGPEGPRAHPGRSSTRSTATTRRSSRSRSSRSSTTTSPRRRAS